MTKRRIAVLWILTLLIGSVLVLGGPNVQVEKALADPDIQFGGLVPAFPGAEGFGAQALADCDKTDIKVIEVTNLNSSGPGSFQDAIQNQLRDGKLDIIIFRTGGTITGGVSLNKNCVYIAGQTAPGDGVQVRHSHTVLGTDRSGNGNNIVIRYLRMRTDKGTPGKGDVMSVTGGHDIIVDHVSAEWGNDENLSINPAALSGGGTEIHDITIQRSIIAEGLSPHSTGTLIGSNDQPNGEPDTYEISVHHNIYAHNFSRNPQVRADDVQVANNIVYNWRTRASASVRGPIFDIRNNTYIKGPWNAGAWLEYEGCDRNGDPIYSLAPSIYVDGNIFGTGSSPNPDQWSFLTHAFTCATAYAHGQKLPTTAWQRATPIADAPIPVTLQSADAAKTSVLNDVGANKSLACNGDWVWTQDYVDADIVTDIQNGTGPSTYEAMDDPDDFGGHPSLAPGFPCPDRDSDGMPDEWETRYYGSPTGAPAISTMAAGGYTVIEHYLNGTDPLSSDQGAPDTTPNQPPSFTGIPMLIEGEDGALTSPMTQGLHSDASGGAYISVPSGTNTTSPVRQATYSVEIPEDGTYYLWARLYGPTSQSDAIYVGINDSWNRVYPSALGIYEWVQVETSSLTRGTHTIQVGHGEVGARLDALYLTNDPVETPLSPTPASASTPTPPTTPTPTPTPVPVSTPTPVPTPTPTPPPTATPIITVGTVSGTPGQTYTLPIYLDTQGTSVRSIQLNLTYDLTYLLNATGAQGADLPDTWMPSSHTPQPGDLRLLAASSNGSGQSFNGEVLIATFTVAANAPEVDVPVRVALADVRDGSNSGMDADVVDGVVTIQAPVVYGDADGDGSVTSGDVNRIIDWLIGMALMPQAGTKDFLAGDVNGEGIINLADVNMMIDFLLGRITRFPVE